MRLKSWLLILLFVLGVPIMSTSCSSSDEQGQPEEVVQEGDQQEEEGIQEEGDQDENLNNAGNENLNNAGFNEEGDPNQFLNNEGNQLGNDFQTELGNEGTQSEGDLQQIIEDMNNANDQFGQQDALPGNQGFENAGQDQGMDQFTESPATTGSPIAPGLPEIGSKMSYIVQRGDTLAKIATKIYGNPQKWSEIASFTAIANPRLIYPGDVVYYQLTQETMAFASKYESMARSSVTVRAGDTLSTIANRVLGSTANWKMIWRQNDNIMNPDRLVAGTTLYYIEPGMLASVIDTAKSIKDSIQDMFEMKVTELDDGNKLIDSNQVVDEIETDSVDEDDFQRFARINGAFDRII